MLQFPANQSEIRKGYRRMAVKYHPDKNKVRPSVQEYIWGNRSASSILKLQWNLCMKDALEPANLSVNRIGRCPLLGG